MNKLLESKKLIYLFVLLFSALAINAFFIYLEFNKTKEAITKHQLHVNLEYIDRITSNLSQNIIQSAGHKPLLQALKDNKNLRENLEKDLRLFRAKRYRYIYVIDKSKNTFRFLLDGSKKNKANFLETFQPFKVQQWEKVYITKTAHYFLNKDVKSLWLTYLKPIIKKNKVIGVIAIDFSLKEHDNLKSILEQLTKDLKQFTILSMAIFLIIILFLLYERKKIVLLKQQSQEIYSFNKTLQKKVADEVAKNREKDKDILEQARLAQLGGMLGMIAHQWRQPLSAISSANIAINMKAQMEQLEPQSVIELTDKIEEYTQHLSTTIDDFRNFFKNTKEIQRTDYTRIITSTLNIVESSVQNKNIKLSTELQSETIFETYPQELKQVVLNLIKNAEDILLENNIQNPYIKITTHENYLLISDNGGGIPKDILDKIFDPYFSTKGLNGTGLGLYMSKIIIEEHCHGTLSVENNDEGAVFTIEL